MIHNKTCIVIVGPTASGKTALSLQLAQHYASVIISADSRQCYRELNIGVAKPSSWELNAVPHYFINSHSIHDEVNAAVFEAYALQSIAEIFSKQDIAILVGGTGLYINAFCDGIDDMPTVNEALRKKLRIEYAGKGIQWLQQCIQENDPLFYEKGEIQNPQRMLRALEIKMSTGRSILEMYTAPKKKRDFNIIKIGVFQPRERLYEMINRRVDKMFEIGLLDEARELRLWRELNALQTVGYSELFDYFDGKLTLEQAVSEIKKHTRHYAKRQLTWFKRDASIWWAESSGLSQMIAYIDKNRTL